MALVEVRTDWAGLLLSLIVPSVVVTGLIWAALQPVSWEDTPGWAWGLLMLIPLEGLRVWVMRVTSRAYREYNSPRQAMMSFTGTIAFGVCVMLAILLFSLGATFSLQALSAPWVWQALLVPFVLAVTDTALGLLLFRGNARAQAARVDAIAVTSGFWFFSALVLPIILGMPAIVFLLVSGPSWIVDPIFEHLRTFLVLYAAAYFAGKAMLLAYLHTARFLRVGRCPVLGEEGGIIDIEERRAALLGEYLTAGRHYE